MNSDISIWDNKRRMRSTIMNQAKTIASLGAINLFFSISNKNWIITGINGLFIVMMIPLFISKTKWEKLPPKPENGQKN